MVCHRAHGGLLCDLVQRRYNNCFCSSELPGVYLYHSGIHASFVSPSLATTFTSQESSCFPASVDMQLFKQNIIHIDSSSYKELTDFMGTVPSFNSTSEKRIKNKSKAHHQVTSLCQATIFFPVT